MGTGLVLAVVVRILLLLVRIGTVSLLSLLFVERAIRLPFLPDFYLLVLQLKLTPVSMVVKKKRQLLR